MIHKATRAASTRSSIGIPNKKVMPRPTRIETEVRMSICMFFALASSMVELARLP